MGVYVQKSTGKFLNNEVSGNFSRIRRVCLITMHALPRGFHDRDPLSSFRHDSELAKKASLIVQQAIQDERASNQPTRSKGRKALRRWECILTHLENYFPWDMKEHKNQARFHSTDFELPEVMKMVFRSGKRVGKTSVRVASIGVATAELHAERYQGLLTGELSGEMTGSEMLAMVIQYQQEAFGLTQALFATLFICHVTQLDIENKLFMCSEVIELGKWNLDEDQGHSVDFPPSAPVSPVITVRPKTSQAGE
jgi:hypothetical protein